MIETVDRRTCWRKGRGIIATALWFLLGFPCACAFNSDHANSLRLANAEIDLQSRKSQLQVLKEELRKCAGEIRAARQEMLRCQAELDGVDSARDAKAALLAAALAKVRLMEEDLAGATRRQAEVAAQLAPLMELEKKVLTRQEAIAALQKQLPALDAQLAAGQESLQARTLELAEVKARLDALAAARKTFDAAVEAALGSTAKQKPDKAGDAPPPKQPPAKKK